MGRAARWLVAAGTTLAVFAVFLWVSGVFILPFWIKSGSDRWVIATGAGLAIGALAALWGVSFARREQQGDGEVVDASRAVDVDMEAEASDYGQVNQAGRNQTIGARHEQQGNVVVDNSGPADIHMKANASGHGRVYQAGQDQTLDER